MSDKPFDEVARQRAVKNIDESVVNALDDKLVDVINESKSTALVIINTCMRIAIRIAIACGSTADDFADGARRAFKHQQEQDALHPVQRP
jgi:hypothetical protein